jgi:hypothetical protein
MSIMILILMLMFFKNGKTSNQKKKGDYLKKEKNNNNNRPMCPIIMQTRIKLAFHMYLLFLDKKKKRKIMSCVQL